MGLSMATELRWFIMVKLGQITAFLLSAWINKWQMLSAVGRGLRAVGRGLRAVGRGQRAVWRSLSDARCAGGGA